MNVDFQGIPIGRVSIRHDRICLEAGLALNADNTFAVRAWVEGNRLDLDLSWTATLISLLVGAGLTTDAATEIIEARVNDIVTGAAERTLTSRPRNRPR